MKNKLIIVMGPHGVGKTHFTDFIRDNLESCNLYRLSGHQVKTVDGLDYSKKMYNSLLKYLEEMAQIPMTLLFDSFFFTEEVFSRLKYKKYDFSNTYQSFVQKLITLNYDIYLINLYLEDTSLYYIRLQGRKHHKYHNISAESSIEQQKVYKNICEELIDTNINIKSIAMDNFDESYRIISNFLLKKE